MSSQGFLLVEGRKIRVGSVKMEEGSERGAFICYAANLEALAAPLRLKKQEASISGESQRETDPTPEPPEGI